MITIQLILSISATVLQMGLYNSVCKKDLNTPDHLQKFNIIMSAVCIPLFGIALIKSQTSLFTIILGLLFGLVTALATVYKMYSLTEGPLHITQLITTSSMIIPTMSGIFFGEKFSIAKLVIVFILIAFIYLSLDKSGKTKFSKKWLLFTSLTFIFQGVIGVLQKIHQTSEHKDEVNGFLFVAFICALVYSMVMSKKSFTELKFTKKHIIIGVVCGLCTYIMNVLNLKLSGLLPTQLFFPLSSGSAIVLSSLMSVLLFKEKLTRKQFVGLCGGLLSLIAICIVE